MQVETFLKFTPFMSMNPHGYIKSDLGNQGLWFRNLLHWISFNGLYMEELQELNEHVWSYMFYTDSNAKEGVSYASYIDVIESPDESTCHVEMSLYTESKDLHLDSKIHSLLERLNGKNSQVRFELVEDKLSCAVQADCSPNEADAEYINKMIYDCFDAIESLMQAQELEPWISTLAN